MKFKVIFFFYSLLFFCLVVFSYGFVDLNFPLKPPFYFDHKVYSQRLFSTFVFGFLILSLFGLYAWILNQVKKKKLASKQVWQLIFLAVAVLFFTFPFLSYDLFNYMATAKVTFFYRENPYLVMPIEFSGEPMLAFMHASNKFALYAPFWILLTAVPHFLAGGNLVLAVFAFKALVVLFYLGVLKLIWKVSEKNIFSLAFFGLNPLVLLETLTSGHNDIVMMFLVLLALWFLFEKKKTLSWLSLLASVGIKYATVVLLPFFAFASRFKKERLIAFSAGALFSAFLLSPLREEIYPWYFIWVLSLVSLVPEKRFLASLCLAFSFGLLLRYLPWFYFRNWGGLTPALKTVATFAPPGLFAFWSFFKLSVSLKSK